MLGNQVLVSAVMGWVVAQFPLSHCVRHDHGRHAEIWGWLL